MVRTILVFGDSLAWGRVPGARQRHPRDRRWPHLLECGIGRDRFQVVDDSLPGRTTVFDEPFRPHRNGLAAIEAALMRHAPLDLVILALGTNDMQDLLGATAEEIGLGLEALITRIRHVPFDPAQAPPPILVLVPPRPLTLLVAEGGRFRSAPGKWPRLRLAFQAVSSAAGCACFDASEVVEADPADGLHLDAAANSALAAALCDPVLRAMG